MTDEVLAELILAGHVMFILALVLFGDHSLLAV